MSGWLLFNESHGTVTIEKLKKKSHFSWNNPFTNSPFVLRLSSFKSIELWPAATRFARRFLHIHLFWHLEMCECEHIQEQVIAIFFVVCECVCLPSIVISLNFVAWNTIPFEISWDMGMSTLFGVPIIFVFSCVNNWSRKPENTFVCHTHTHTLINTAKLYSMKI